MSFWADVVGAGKQRWCQMRGLRLAGSVSGPASLLSFNFGLIRPSLTAQPELLYVLEPQRRWVRPRLKGLFAQLI